jgi:hypothetical protein
MLDLAIVQDLLQRIDEADHLRADEAKFRTIFSLVVQAARLRGVHHTPHVVVDSYLASLALSDHTPEDAVLCEIAMRVRAKWGGRPHASDEEWERWASGQV